MKLETGIPIAPEQQLEFLSGIQRLLSEGQFTATYKYALLLAIADICVEDGEDTAAPFEISTEKSRESSLITTGRRFGLTPASSCGKIQVIRLP
jgi:hypothetical protein